MNISILIPSFGNPEWEEVVWSRSHPSTQGQEAEVLTFHDPEGTLASVRNELAAQAKGEWLLFLDADDELAPGFLGAMRALMQESGGFDGAPLLLTPARSYVIRGRKTHIHFEPERDLREGNWLPIGTLLQKSLFHEVGGFRDWPLFEDWDLWLRCSLAGAEIRKVPDALYLAHVRLESRNRRRTMEERNYWHQKIGRANCPDIYDSPSEEEDRLQRVAGVRKAAWAYS